MTRTRAALVLILALGLLAGSCGDEGAVFAPGGTGATTTAAPTTAAETTTTAPGTTAAPTTTLAETTTTTIPPTTTTTAAPPPACSGPGAGPIPAGAAELSSVTAQLDGDGTPDEFSAFLFGGTWYLHARLASGYATQLALDPAWAAGRWTSELDPVLVDGARSFGTSRQAVLVVLNIGLAFEYGLFALEDCAIVALALSDGTLPSLWALGSPAHSDWPVCGPDATLVQVVFGSPEGCGDIHSCATPTLSATEYRVLWDPARLEFVGDTSRASTAAEMDEFQSRTCLTP